MPIMLIGFRFLYKEVGIKPYTTAVVEDNKHIYWN